MKHKRQPTITCDCVGFTFQGGSSQLYESPITHDWSLRECCYTPEKLVVDLGDCHDFPVGWCCRLGGI